MKTMNRLLVFCIVQFIAVPYLIFTYTFSIAIGMLYGRVYMELMTNAMQMAQTAEPLAINFVTLIPQVLVASVIIAAIISEFFGIAGVIAIFVDDSNVQMQARIREKNKQEKLNKEANSNSNNGSNTSNATERKTWLQGDY